MNSHDTDRLAILISIDVAEDFIDVRPWIIGPFPDGTDYEDLLYLGDQIYTALSSRYPADTEIEVDIVEASPVIHGLDLDVEQLADSITNEHRAVDPDLADTVDDVYDREILDASATDEDER